MSVTLHLTQFFSTASPNIFKECDALMEELLVREEADPTVRDAAVSADAGTGLVEVEVVADGETDADAEQAALSRIRAAVTSVVPLSPSSSYLRERDRSKERVLCCA